MATIGAFTVNGLLKTSLRLSSEFQVNTTTAGGQHDSSVTSLSDGGFVVTWTAFIIDGNSSIYGQRYAADGSTVDTEFPVQTDTQTTGYQSAVAGLEDGGFVVTWMKQLELTYSDPGIDDYWDIYGRRFGEDGTALDAAFRINSSDPYTQEYPDIAALPDGGFVVVWQSFGQDESAQGIYGQVFSEFGDPVGTEFRVNTTTDSAQQRPSVAALADGGFVVTWESFEPSLEKFHVFGQRYKLTVGSSNLDIDGDGVPDNTDAFPDDPAASVDTDSDGKPDDWNDGKSAADSSSDPILVIDEDDDNDGVADFDDAFPRDPSETQDSDGDGEGDNRDGFPDDSTRIYVDLATALANLPDDAFRACVQNASNGLASVADVKSIYCGNKSSIRSISGIEAFIELSSLDIHDTRTGDLAPLTYLTKLTNLKVSQGGVGNEISSFEPLRYLWRLEELSISGGSSADWSIVKRFRQLKWLALAGVTIFWSIASLRLTGRA